jgi:hypothetical protein
VVKRIPVPSSPVREPELVRARLRTLTRWAIAASTAGAAFLVALAFHETPNHAKAQPHASGQATTVPPAAAQNDQGLSRPTTVPQTPSSSGSHVVTGQT